MLYRAFGAESKIVYNLVEECEAQKIFEIVHDSIVSSHVLNLLFMQDHIYILRLCTLPTTVLVTHRESEVLEVTT